MALLPLRPADPFWCCALSWRTPPASPPSVCAFAAAAESILAAFLPLLCPSAPPPLPPSIVAPAASTPTITLPRCCLIAAIATTPDVPTTAAALLLPPVDPPAEANAYDVSAAPATALDATVPASAVVALGRYAARRSRRYRPPLPLTPQFAAPDNPAHASALGSRLLLTAPRSRLSLLPLPPLAPLRC